MGFRFKAHLCKGSKWNMHVQKFEIFLSPPFPRGGNLSGYQVSIWQPAEFSAVLRFPKCPIHRSDTNIHDRTHLIDHDVEYARDGPLVIK